MSSFQTNFFHTTDPDRLKKIVKGMFTTGGYGCVTSGEYEGRYYFAGHGLLLRYNGGSFEDLCKELQKVLPEDEAISIFEETDGADSAVIITPKECGRFLYTDLVRSEIRRMLGDENWQFFR